MTERLPVGDIRPKSKDLVLPPDKAKELSDLIPKPETHFHYKITGDWQENREVYRVMEGDSVISDYTFPDKADMSRVQLATRKTYTKEVNFLGSWVDAPVQYDKKSGKWKKLGFIQKVKQVFHKETNIPAQVLTDMTDGKEKSVLHTLEQKRPVGDMVREAKIETLSDVQADLGLKYKHMDMKVTELEATNRVLKTEVATSTAIAASLKAQLAESNRKVAELTAQLHAAHSGRQDQVNQNNPHYEGPIYTKPNPADVIEGEVVA